MGSASSSWWIILLLRLVLLSCLHPDEKAAVVVEVVYSIPILDSKGSEHEDGGGSVLSVSTSSSKVKNRAKMDMTGLFSEIDESGFFDDSIGENGGEQDGQGNAYLSKLLLPFPVNNMTGKIDLLPFQNISAINEAEVSNAMLYNLFAQSETWCSIRLDEFKLELMNKKHITSNFSMKFAETRIQASKLFKEYLDYFAASGIISPKKIFGSLSLVDSVYSASQFPVNFEFRMLLLFVRAKLVLKFNTESNAPYKKALNIYSMILPSEIRDYSAGTHINTDHSLDGNPPKEEEEEEEVEEEVENDNSGSVDVEIPKYFDLRDHQAVSPVVNQGSCGCCWAISAADALATAYKNITGKMYALSFQNLIDCSTNDSGCNGGTFQSAWRWISTSLHGLASKERYPYKAVQETCNTGIQGFVKSSGPPVYRSVYTDLEIVNALLSGSAVSIAVQSSNSCFKDYSSGILVSSHCNCFTSRVDHAILLVGWGEENGIKYWIVKNSWGYNWGEHGFIRMERRPEKDNFCGMYQQSAYPVNVLSDGICSSANPASYCGELVQNQYRKSDNGSCVLDYSGPFKDTKCTQMVDDASNNIPDWGWALIGILIGLFLIVMTYCIYEYCYLPRFEATTSTGGGRRLGGDEEEEESPNVPLLSRT